jgi:iron complex outermembrane receptor protein
MWDFKVSKTDLFALPAGDVGFASGVEWRRETFLDDRDNRLDGTTTYTNSVTGVTYGTDVMGASGSVDVDAHRSIASAFAELAVPIVSPEMRIPFVEEIQLQLAVRGEDYSDFGTVIKPKGAILWTVGQGFALRGSVSQSFRAPNLPQFYSPGSTVTNTRIDTAFCRINTPAATPCAGASTLEVRSGNENLKAEEADNASVGFVYQPKFIPLAIRQAGPDQRLLVDPREERHRHSRGPEPDQLRPAAAPVGKLQSQCRARRADRDQHGRRDRLRQRHLRQPAAAHGPGL